MSEKYKVYDNTCPTFITITVVDWVDLFTRKVHKDLIIESLKYCQESKGLLIHAYAIMPSHLHLIVSSKEEHSIASTIRDFKKFTSGQLIKNIKEISESRREWLLNKFSYAANRVKRGKNYKVWKDGFHPVQLETTEMMEQRLNYVHENPVNDGITSSAEAYVYSSAADYMNEQWEGGLLRLDPII